SDTPEGLAVGPPEPPHSGHTHLAPHLPRRSHDGSERRHQDAPAAAPCPAGRQSAESPHAAP
ncbi:hypothetical protein ABTJ97_19730, partial [Acinetobacter baumannii]